MPITPKPTKHFVKRIVFGWVYDGVDPVVNSKVKFILNIEEVGFTVDTVMIQRAIYAPTDEDGYFEQELWCDEDSEVAIDWRVYYPTENNQNEPPKKAKPKDFSLSIGDGEPIEIGLAMKLGVGTPPDQQTTILQAVYAYILILIANGTIGNGGGGTSDHSALTNLNADDHVQYYNQTRGDARYELTANKNQPSGYAGLNSGGKIAPSLLPDTDSLTEGGGNKFFTAVRAYAAQIGSLSIVAAAITLGDSLGVIVGKLQGQINSLFDALSGKADLRVDYVEEEDAAFTLDADHLGKMIGCTNGSDITITITDSLGAGFNSAAIKEHANDNQILFLASGDVEFIFPPGHNASDSFSGAIVSIYSPDGHKFYIGGATALLETP